MKLYFNESGRLTNVTDRDFLVQGNDGVNLIEIYGPWALMSVVTLMFQRADGFVIGELEAKKGLDNWYFALDEKWGILSVPGQLQMTVSVYSNNTKQNQAMYTTNVYGSITIPDDGRSYFEWYVADKLVEHAEKLNYLESNIGVIEYGNELTEEIVPQKFVLPSFSSTEPSTISTEKISLLPEEDETIDLMNSQSLDTKKPKTYIYDLTTGKTTELELEPMPIATLVDTPKEDETIFDLTKPQETIIDLTKPEEVIDLT